MAGGRGLKLAGLSCAELELCFAVGGRYGQLLADAGHTLQSTLE